MHTSVHPQKSTKFQENKVPIVNGVEEQAQHIVGSFSDARLKKTVRFCLRGWWRSKRCVCASSGGRGREKCAWVAGWGIGK